MPSFFLTLIIFSAYTSFLVANKFRNGCGKRNISTWKLFPSDFHPTADEISRGVVLRAPSQWGIQIRKEKNLRILALGGSNTAVGAYGQYYVDRLREKILHCDILNAEQSYVMNEGMSGVGPTKKKFAFEDEPISKWPNLVTLEFAVNTPNDWWTAREIDDLIVFIKAKFSDKGVLVPAILVIEMMTIREYYPEESRHIWEHPGVHVKPIRDTSGVSRLDAPSEHGHESFNRGTMGGVYIAALARFYGFPMVSIADALFPSFLRYYTSYANTTMWPYSKDGIHISELGGDVLIDDILFPLLVNELEPRDTDSLFGNETSIFGKLDFRMFPMSTYSGGLVSRWSSWGNELNTLSDRVVKANTTGFEFMSTPGHADGRHTCLGASTAQAVATFGFNLHPSLLSLDENQDSPYRLSVGFLFSWNASFVGKAACSIFETSPNEYERKVKKIGNTALLDFGLYKGRRVHDTTLRQVRAII